ncbi:hypothetical protein PHYSODRAFT_337130 [Phytophthora sojae]|uniref:Retrotransposon Copia-like N-terminal domain-containing protein n=1 Tax=Phytophthora sojae (strain P6497) TaxID=1094619 RepID=G4ZYA1_PHYSP|nr:hypothetical protein PHYSODRAFT_337130 [Phytophthora sojae]EGZ12713.1 hypothetical protein PHYSODRAFT_337130 [Phytophthora sojae]|eukprot:XP_009533046.1 hypothetical protein PHYSODRAFT_337130 [Phytophthora sojae]
MSSSQASSDDFTRLIGADNFDVWKAPVCAALDGKQLLGFVTKPDYDGVTEDSGSDMSDADDPPKTTPARRLRSIPTPLATTRVTTMTSDTMRLQISARAPR